MSRNTEQGVELYEIYNMTQIVQWLEFNLASLVFEEQTMWNERNENDIRIANFNSIITPIRFLSTRRKSMDNPSGRFNDLFGDTWNYNSMETFSGLKEDENLSKEGFQMWEMFKYYEDVKPEEHVEGAFMILSNLKTPEDL